MSWTIGSAGSAAGAADVRSLYTRLELHAEQALEAGV